MKTIKKEATIGKGKDISVFSKAEADGEVVYPEEEGDSILFPFLLRVKELIINNIEPGPNNGQALMELWENSGSGGPYGIGGSDFDERNVWRNINGLSGDNPVTVNTNGELTVPGGNYPSNAEDPVGVIIVGLDGNTDLNGRHTGSDFNIVNNNTIEINNVAQTGSEDISSAYLAILYEISDYRRLEESQDPGPRDPQIYLGRDNTANSIDYSLMRDPIFGGSGDNLLQYNALTLNEPDIDTQAQTSTIVLSREVHNQGTVQINAREIGVFCKDQGDDTAGFGSSEDQHAYWYLIAKDIIDVTIGVDSIVSFTYRIRTSCEDAGGIMTNFNELLYRQLSAGNRTVQDINNSDLTSGPSFSQFYGLSRDGHYDRLTGVQIGNATSVVNAGDKSLGGVGGTNTITYGEGDGQVFPVGSWVDKIQVDQANDEAFFDVHRIFENRGSTDISVNEVAYYVDAGGPVMITRHQTNSTITLSPGENLKATMRFSISV